MFVENKISNSPFSLSEYQQDMSNPFMDDVFKHSTQNLTLLANSIPDNKDPLNYSPFMIEQPNNIINFDTFISLLFKDFEEDEKLKKIKKYVKFNAYIPLHIERTTSCILDVFKKREKHIHFESCGVLFLYTTKIFNVRFNKKLCY